MNARKKSPRPRRRPATTSPASTVRRHPARADRPELLRMIADLQPGEVVIAEKVDRISRLPRPSAWLPRSATRAHAWPCPV